MTDRGNCLKISHTSGLVRRRHDCLMTAHEMAGEENEMKNERSALVYDWSISIIITSASLGFCNQENVIFSQSSGHGVET